MSKTSAAAAKALTSRHHFELFGLAPAFALDLERLDAAYRDIQSNVHPDRFAQRGRRRAPRFDADDDAGERGIPHPASSPVLRAAYLLGLNGVDVGLETNTAMPREFLMEQMELRERLEEARNADDLGLLEQELFGLKEGLQARIAESIDVRRDFRGAADLVRKLMFLEKLDEDINAAYEALDA